MQVSIVIAVLDSHEIVRRQVLYYTNMPLPLEAELIIVDDGSTPSITPYFIETMNIRFYYSNDFRRWTQGLARMQGIAQAKGKYILCTDIDHIISKETIDAAINFKGDKMVFKRRFAYLDNTGNLIRDKQKLIEWGLDETTIRDDELTDGTHGNSWLIRKQVFEDLGQYNIGRCESGTHLQGEDRDFNHRYNNAARAGKVKPAEWGPPIYFFPMGRYHKTGDENPHGLFHKMYKEKWGEDKSGSGKPSGVSD